MTHGSWSCIERGLCVFPETFGPSSTRLSVFSILVSLDSTDPGYRPSLPRLSFPTPEGSPGSCLLTVSIQNL